MRLILDLCGGTGAWSKPYRDADYQVEIVDTSIMADDDIRRMKVPNHPVHGILAAPPCTCFSYARNRYEPTDEEYLAALSVADACLRIVALSKPAWWALENPINKIRRWYGEPKMVFQQWEYGGPGIKRTGIWGDFNIPMQRPGPRTKPSTHKTKRQNADPEDAITPAGFAKAFFEANP